MFRDVIFSKRFLGGNVGRHTFLTSFLLCFGGGVLLATTMIHLLPEISHNLEDSADRLELEFLPELVVCAGFFLIYLVEELAELVLGGQEKSVMRDSRGGECCHSDLERHLGASTSHKHNYGSIADQTELLNTDQADSETLPAQKSTALREFFTSKTIKIDVLILMNYFLLPVSPGPVHPRCVRGSGRGSGGEQQGCLDSLHW